MANPLGGVIPDHIEVNVSVVPSTLFPVLVTLILITAIIAKRKH